MRSILIGFLASALCSVATVVVQGQQPPPPQRAGVPMANANDAPGRVTILVPYIPLSLELDKESAGLSKGSAAELLNWERVYALALLRTAPGEVALPWRSTPRPSPNNPRATESPTSPGSARSSWQRSPGRAGGSAIRARAISNSCEGFR